jgi:hypothetical protein
MKLIRILILFPLLLGGCARTTVWSPEGRRVIRTSGDVAGLKYAGPNFAFAAEKIDHSTPTLAQGKAASDRLTAAGTAFATSGILTLIK